MKRIVRGQFDSVEQMDRLITQYERQKKEDRRKCEQLGWILTFTDKQSLLEAFARMSEPEDDPDVLAGRERLKAVKPVWKD